VPPHDAAHIGDSVHADVEGAAGVGITPILLDRRRRYADRPDELPSGTHVVHSLDALLSLLS
jgi:FMN phosphatase YigB (HAD superfamily)